MEIAIITFLILVTTGFGLYRWQRNPSGEPRESVPPLDFGGLFPADVATPGQQSEADANASRKAAEYQEQLLTRAHDGDLTCLTDAHAAGGDALYEQVLDSLTAWASGRQESLKDIVSYIVNHPELRANKTVADSVLVSWAANPAAYPAADVMHFAALANDAQAYLTAVQTAMRLWREVHLPRLSAAQLHQLVESQYWIMSGEVRASGAGFLLKQQMARLRDELARPRSDGPQ
jgi:hypothetical protein